MADRVSLFTDSYPERRSIRAILFDTTGELLFHAVQNTGEEPFFTTFGGGVEGSESPAETLTRELYEELDATAVVGRELFSVPGHRFFIARVTRLGEKPFTHGPEFANTTGQKFWVERVAYRAASDEHFSLQPRLLQTFLKDYERVVFSELVRISEQGDLVGEKFDE